MYEPQVRGHGLHGEVAVRQMGGQIPVHPGHQVLGVALHRLEIGLHPVGEGLPQLAQGGLLGGGVEQIVPLGGDGGDVAALRRREQGEHDLAVDVAHHLRPGALAAADVPVEAGGEVHRLCLALVADEVAQRRELRLVIDVHLAVAGGGKVPVLPPVEHKVRVRPAAFFQLGDDLAQHLGHLLQVDGLFHIAGGPQLDGAFQIFLVGVAAEEDELALGIHLPHRARQFQAVHPGHFHVADDDVRPVLPRQLQRFGPVRGRVHPLHAQLFPGQTVPQNFPGHLFVVRHKHRKPHGAPLAFFAFC